ncbi:sensor histidine kinase [Rhodococcus globerulus]|uniref:sensor histidine kinase n=1 Tax=Rhodococcus globerulus TaxID=33008 RepID=UPI000524E660|nr:sensor histidine kinase [Rhodococcus globerulus]PVX59604.1 signal transduction histidine kinase [Rhodococcus globerulus]
MVEEFSFARIARLRLGLHVLVVVLALIVLLRAVLLSEASAGWIGALTAAFLVVYIVGAGSLRAPVARFAWLGSLCAVWVAMALLGADAAYVSFGLILLFMTEVPLIPAVSAVAAITLVNALIGVLTRGQWGGALVGSLLGAVVGVVIGLGFRVLFHETERRQQLIEDLHHTRSELAKTERAAGELAERERLAREIHDTVAQGLSSIEMLLHAAEAEILPPGAEGKIVMARRTASAGLADTRRLIAALSPADLAGSSLVDALSRVCERAAAGTCDIRLLVEGPAVSLPMPVESALVRLGQGAVANVMRHADAHRAVVTLTYGPDAVHLDVVDDGHGFDVAILDDSSTHNFGLKAMQARVEQLSGQWTIESEPGHTAMSVTFPLAHQQEEQQ